MLESHFAQFWTSMKNFVVLIEIRILLYSIIRIEISTYTRIWCFCSLYFSMLLNICVQLIYLYMYFDSYHWFYQRIHFIVWSRIPTKWYSIVLCFKAKKKYHIRWKLTKNCTVIFTENLQKIILSSTQLKLLWYL